MNEIEQAETRIDFDPEHAVTVRERIDELYRLLKKHRANSVSDLLTLQEELQQKANLTSNLDEALQKAEADFIQAGKILEKEANKLSQSRKAVFDPLCNEITELLKELGIPHGTLQVEHSRTTPAAHGADQIEILFSANKGIFRGLRTSGFRW